MPERHISFEAQRATRMYLRRCGPPPTADQLYEVLTAASWSAGQPTDEDGLPCGEGVVYDR